MIGNIRAWPCQFCGWREPVLEKRDRDSAQTAHERQCELGRDCYYCSAVAGQRCKTKSGKSSPTHAYR